MITHKIRKNAPMWATHYYHDDGTCEMVCNLRDDGSIAEVNIDQFAGSQIMLNSKGFICNDIMVFEQAQSDSVARAALARLKTINSGSLPQDMDVDTALKMVIPSNYGTPAEYVKIQRSFAELSYKEQMIAAEMQKVENNKIDFTENKDVE